MLESLHVKNVALIDETEINFKKGLNILTGETGAGKSVLIGSINLALGAKADKDIIRTGAEYGFVELVFSVTSEEQREKLKELDIYPEEDMLILQRRILPGKSICKVNGETVSGRTVKEIAEILIDIHGQHEHQSLLHKKKHFEILDEFSGKELADIKAIIRTKYNEYKKIEKELEQAGKSDSDKEKELNFARFEADEIQAAKLYPGEDEELEQKFRKMSNAKKIAGAVSGALMCLSESDEGQAASLIGRAYREIKNAEEYDASFASITAQLADAEEIIGEVSRSLSHYMQDMEFGEEEFSFVSERLDSVNRLKQKYGNTIEAILAYREERENFIRKLEDYDNYLQGLLANSEKIKAEIIDLCQKAHDIRLQNAGILSKKMQEALIDLNFLGVNFTINVHKTDNFGPEGFDEVEFMISLNPGEGLKALGNVASGGELSRIMLALKTVLADKDSIETLIFDEIDAGISGKTAWKVSEKLAVLGNKHQVLCITHLPQIAAMADEHLLIEKMAEGEKTNTVILALNKEDSIMELARLLGSDIITDTVIQNARELKQLAADTKQY